MQRVRKIKEKKGREVGRSKPRYQRLGLNSPPNIRIGIVLLALLI